MKTITVTDDEAALLYSELSTGLEDARKVMFADTGDGDLNEDNRAWLKRRELMIRAILDQI